jgi:hypothetical protein
MSEEKYALIGNEPQPGQPKKTWRVPIDELPVVDPKSFFITTGEAVVKTDYMIEQIQNLLKEVRALRKKLLKSKEESKYLETCWENGVLIVKRKDPRKKS